jgi:hypothetical protein
MAMSEVRTILQDALKELDSSVDRIEQAVTQKLQKHEESQHDLFAVNTAHAANKEAVQNRDVANTNDVQDVDPAAVARKLDKAISRVEQVLKEG